VSNWIQLFSLLRQGKRGDARSLFVPESDMVGQNRLVQLWVIHRTDYLEILLPVGEDLMCGEVEGGILWVGSGYLEQLPFDIPTTMRRTFAQ